MNGTKQEEQRKNINIANVNKEVVLDTNEVHLEIIEEETSIYSQTRNISQQKVVCWFSVVIVIPVDF
jgi:methyl coenzyme M reductase subunit D